MRPYPAPISPQESKWEPPFTAVQSVWASYDRGWPLAPRKTPEGRDIRWLCKTSLRYLVSRVSFEAYRARYPGHPVTFPPNMAGFWEDGELLHVFWMALTQFASPREVVSAFAGYAEEGLSKGEEYTVLGACAALCHGLDVKRHPYLGYLIGGGAAVELLAAVVGLVAGLRGSLSGREGGGGEGGTAIDAALKELQDWVGVAGEFIDTSIAVGGIGLIGTTPLIHAVQQRMGFASPAAASAAAGKSGGLGEEGEGEEGAHVSLPSLDPDPLFDLLRPPPPTPSSSSSSSSSLSLWSSYPIKSLAQAIALEDWDLFRAIPLCELLGCGWDSERFENSATACQRFNARYEALSLWVSAEILTQPSIRHAAAVWARTIALAGELRALNDFSGVFACATGWRRDEVKRLSSVRALLPPAAASTLAAILALTDDAGKNRAYKGVYFAAGVPQGRGGGGGSGGSGGNAAEAPPPPPLSAPLSYHHH